MKSIIFLLISVFIISSPLFLMGCDGFKPPVCVETSPVKEILSVERRYGTVLLENGVIKTINQGKYKKGT